MKKNSLRLTIVCLLCLVMLLSACSLPFGKNKADETSSTVTVEEAVNMMDLEGVYSEQLAHRGALTLTATDSQNVKITIDWPSSASESAHWEMTGTYDPSKQAILYSDSVLTEQTFNENGEHSDRIVSSSGTGKFTVSGKNLVWTDDLAYIGSDPSTFVYASSLNAAASQGGSLVVSSDTSTTSSSQQPAAAPVPTPTPTPAPTPTPTPAPTPVPTPAPGSPVITKDPTDETVRVGGSCWFVANHKGALLARWHFIAPDGTDLQYDEAASKFPTLTIKNGEYDSMKLSNIPAELNGYRFYCRFSNNNGSVDSKSATLTVEGSEAGAAAPTAAGNGPTVTKDPTDETVKPGESAWFVAKHNGAILARWHFVSPEGQDYIYSDEAIAKEFPTLSIKNGDQGAMQLVNIPLNANGWKVYCRYSNNNGSVDTKSATITVQGADAGTAGANNTAANAPKVVKDPTDETVKPGETAWFVARHTGATTARWHFVSPDGSDYVYTDAAVSKEFPQMKIVNGDQGTMQLQNIPMNANGWKVYCRYSNNDGSVDTKAATITVQAGNAATNTPAPTTVVDAAADSDEDAPDDMNAVASSSSMLVGDWTDVDDLDSAISISGVSFSPPAEDALPDGTIFFGYRAKAGLIEANYTDENSLTIRKSTTTSGNDLIGDYTNYSGSWPLEIGALTVLCRGDGTTINAATYSLPDGNVSISYNMGEEGNGLTADQVIALVDGIQ